ncbi:Uncharacterised protein [[Flavobacterium] thermophilum]|nr:Uncharacterised protein [[Flavobacterium] thermophilum]
MIKRFEKMYYNFLVTNKNIDDILEESKMDWLPYVIWSGIMIMIVVGNLLTVK